MTKADFTTSEINIAAVEPQLAAVVRKRVAFADIPAAQRAARAALDAALKAAEAHPAGPTLTVWRMPEAGVLDYAPGVFVDGDFLPGRGEQDSVTLFTLPRGRAAHLRVTGSYEALPEAWGRLFAGCQDQALAGLNWEIYTTPGSAQGTIETDLYALLA